MLSPILWGRWERERWEKEQYWEAVGLLIALMTEDRVKGQNGEYPTLNRCSL